MRAYRNRSVHGKPAFSARSIYAILRMDFCLALLWHTGPLRLLLDENISQVVATQVQKHRPAVQIDSVHTWQEGAFRGRRDRELLLAAEAEGLTLVTYDLKTIPPLLSELYAEGRAHAGVVFVDSLTIGNDAFGTLTRALIFFWERHEDLEWRDRVHFLDKPPG